MKSLVYLDSLRRPVRFADLRFVALLDAVVRKPYGKKIVPEVR